MDAKEFIEQTAGISEESYEAVDHYTYYKETLLSLKDMNDKLHWTAGDILLKAKEEFGEEIIERLSYDTDVDVKTLKQWAWVSEKYPDEDMRTTTRSWSHYRAAAATDTPMLWITEAENNDWSVRRLSEEIKNVHDAAEVASGTLCTNCHMPLPDTGARHVRMDNHKEASLCSTKCTLDYYLKVYNNEKDQFDVECEAEPLTENEVLPREDFDDLFGEELAVLEP